MTATKGKASNGKTGIKLVATSRETTTCITAIGSQSNVSAEMRWP
jgi:hypothetical protein